MDAISRLYTHSGDLSGVSALMALSIVVLMFVCLVLYKVYRASLNVQSRLNEFSRIAPSDFGTRMMLLEIESEEYRLNRDALGPLARLIDEYCVLMVSAEGHLTYVNDRMASLVDQKAQHLANKSICFLDPHRYLRGWAEVGKELKPRKVWHGEISGETIKGKEYWLDAFALPLSFITEHEDGWLFLATDISELKSANKALEDRIRRKEEEISRVESMLFHSEKMASLGTISAGIAHEINSPIAFVSSNLTTMQRYVGILKELLPTLRRLAHTATTQTSSKVSTLGSSGMGRLEAVLDDSEELVRDTIDGVDRVKRIISDLRSFAHDSAGEREPVAIQECIDSALSLARHDLRNGIEVSVSIDHPDDALVLGSPTQVTQVLVNLLVNAAQAMKFRGRIQVASRMEQKHIVITVTDNGPGIDAQVAERIFEPFFTTKGVGEGTGLGLSISQDIIKRHQGQLSVESQSGQGSCFTIRLPVMSEKVACEQ